MIKVTMNLSEKDVEDTDTLCRSLRARSKAHAVSVALSLTRYIVDALAEPNTQLLLRRSDGTIERLVVPGLEMGSRWSEPRVPVQRAAKAVA